jgi:hypothetical protein
MNNKIEIAFGKHIERLEKDVAEAQTRIDKQGLSLKDMDATGQKDDLKKIALLREGAVPKYSDLPVENISRENNLPKIEMFEFSDLLELVNETNPPVTQN